jgi:hypothetical protein
MATSHAPPPPTKRVSAQALSRDSGHGAASTGGRDAAAASSDHRDEIASGTTVVSPAAGSPAPVWQSASWPAARDEALSAVRNGRINDKYRDLVREYFNDPAK